MDERNFCYWLQGFFEISGDVKSLNEDQIKMIKDHLNYVFGNEKLPDAKKVEELLKPRAPAGSSAFPSPRRIC